jgi:hypothetical protein
MIAKFSYHTNYKEKKAEDEWDRLRRSKSKML